MSVMSKLYQISKEIVAPVLIQYVQWVLEEAKARGISTLYFLARDGYILQKIGQHLSDKYGYEIECRYLYASRASLRMPSYHLIGDEAFDLIFQYDHQITLNTLFRRVNAPTLLQSKILQELDLNAMDPDRVLTISEVNELRQKFQTCEAYCAHVMQHSEACFRNAVGYFRQEGLFDQSAVAIVDSGWTGSMQRSLRQILTAAGYRGNLTGFYFGMLKKPGSAEDGEYVSWFFSSDRQLCNRVLFNIYLFEIMLSAPHGMTLGYTETADGYGPVLGDMPRDSILESVSVQLRGIMDALQSSCNLRKTAVCRKFRRLMAWPGMDEVEAYNCFQICSDTTEDKFVTLAEERCLDYLKKMTIPRRIWRKLIHKQIVEESSSLWPCGTMAYEKSPVRRAWYRFNYLLTVFILQIIK